MTREEIIRMAREAGFFEDRLYWQNGAVEHFAELIASAEREACAKVCDERASRNEAYAQDAIANGENGEISSLRALAWQMKVCATEIRHRCDE